MLVKFVLILVECQVVLVALEVGVVSSLMRGVAIPHWGACVRV